VVILGFAAAVLIDYFVSKPLPPSGPLVITVITLLFLGWAASVKLEVTPNRLVYRSVLRGSVSIDRQAMSSVSLEVGWGKELFRTRPFVRLAIYTSDEKAPTIINANLFTKAAVRRIVAELEERR
jgi:hypothetical protein